MILLELDAACFRLQWLRGNPLGTDRKAQCVCPVTQRLVSCPVRWAPSVIIPHDCESYLRIHLLVPYRVQISCHSDHAMTSDQWSRSPDQAEPAQRQKEQSD